MATADELWRADVSDRLERTAVILERLKGELDVHDTRLNALEASPANNRANVQVIIAALGLIGAALACVIGPLIGALIGLAIQQLAR